MKNFAFSVETCMHINLCPICFISSPCVVSGKVIKKQNSEMSPEEYTVEEQEAIQELKRRLDGEMDQEMFADDNMFIRFLRARNFNMNAAETMLRNHISWRKVINTDKILKEYTPREVIEKYLTMNRLGFDKEGSPIIYSHFGNLDTKGLLKSMKKSDEVKTVVKRLETDVLAMKEESAKRGKCVDKWTIILNFENFSLSTATHKPSVEAFSTLVAIYEANYPERLKAAYIINAQLYFTIAFAAIKPFLSGPTAKKINIFGKSGWKEELLKHIDADVLPAFLGGTLTDPDGNPACKTFINYGGLVPERYYIRRSSKEFSQLPGIKKYTVARMSKVELIMTVNEPGSLIEWEFETNKDIGFSLLYKENNTEEAKVKEVIPKQRIHTCISEETGVFKCERPGIYIIEFDNTYSWMFQKEIYCKAAVVSQDRQRVFLV